MASTSTKVVTHHHHHLNSVTTTKTIEQHDTVVQQKHQHQPAVVGSSLSSADNVNSPNFVYSHLTSSAGNSGSGQKLKSWSNLAGGEGDTNSNLRSPRVESQVGCVGGLRSWKATGMSNSEKNVGGNCKELNVNFSSQYDEELFSPRLASSRGGSESKRIVLNPVSGSDCHEQIDKSEQEIEIQLSPGKNIFLLPGTSSFRRSGGHNLF